MSDQPIIIPAPRPALTPTPRPAPRPSSSVDTNFNINDEKAIWVALDNAEDLTYNLVNIADNSLAEQMARFQDFNKTGLATANLVRYSITDEDHFPYTRRFRGAPTFCEARIVDRAAGFRPRQDACYASANIVSGITNLTGGSGFLCGAPGHKSSVSVGGLNDNGVMLDNTTVVENFSSDATKDTSNSARYTASSLSRSATAPASVYPRQTSVGGTSYDTVPSGSNGAKTAYPVTCYQTSCNTVFPCHGRNEGSEFNVNILRI